MILREYGQLLMSLETSGLGSVCNGRDGPDRSPTATSYVQTLNDTFCE